MPQAVLEAEEQRGRFSAAAMDLKLALSGLQARRPGSAAAAQRRGHGDSPVARPARAKKEGMCCCPQTAQVLQSVAPPDVAEDVAAMQRQLAALRFSSSVRQEQLTAALLEVRGGGLGGVVLVRRGSSLQARLCTCGQHGAFCFLVSSSPQAVVLLYMRQLDGPAAVAPLLVEGLGVAGLGAAPHREWLDFEVRLVWFSVLFSLLLRADCKARLGRRGRGHGGHEFCWLAG